MAVNTNPFASFDLRHPFRAFVYIEYCRGVADFEFEALKQY